MPLKAVLFDMGDTLVGGFRDRYLKDICRNLDLAQDSDREALLGATAERFLALRQRGIRTHEQHRFEDVLWGLWKDRGKPIPRRDIYAYSDTIFQEITRETFCFPEVHEVLDELRKRLFVIGIVSNVSFSPYRYELLLRRHGLTRFQTVVFSSALFVRKPHPAIFCYALNRLGVRPHESLYVGDQIGRDILGAHAVDMRAVWINRNGNVSRYKSEKAQPEWEIKDLRELLPIVDAQS